ncbi:erythromycin esterase family protein [Pontibacter toksunensis]|uniref:Erythromycin esterase family protein n=1 Tax=Pontibacter toksunensis TaxID=1332631 RepID=A0ABW6BMF0_9BACT
MGIKFSTYCLSSILILGTTASVLAQETDERVAWLRQNAIPISLTSFPDSQALAYFDKALAGKQVVVLGEQNHGDGTTFQLYSNLVKLLHSRYGFDAIVFESGFYDCHKAWQSIMQKEDAQTAINNSVFKLWAHSEQVQPMIGYIAAQANTPNPLEVGGFDCQFTGYYGKKVFLTEVDSIVQVLSPGYFTSKEYRSFRKTANSITDYSLPPVLPSTEERLLFDQGINQVLALLEASPSKERAFWLQAMKNLQVQSGVVWSLQKVSTGKMTGRELNNMRDVQMAKNVVWLLEGPYKGRKIILWANSAHTMKNTESLVPQSGRDVFKGATTMGDHLFDIYRERLYVIGTLSYQGQTGLAHHPQITEVAPAPAGSLNHLFHLANQEAAFLDLNTQESQNSWISQDIIARPDASILFQADWTKVLDGVFFVHDMKPSRKAKSNQSNGK